MGDVKVNLGGIVGEEATPKDARPARTAWADWPLEPVPDAPPKTEGEAMRLAWIERVNAHRLALIERERECQ